MSGGIEPIVTIVTPDSVPTVPNADDYEFNNTTSSLPSGWSWFNQGSSVYSEALGWGGIVIPSQGSDNVRGIVRNLPAAGTYTLTMKISLAGKNAANVYGGPIMRESSSGKMWGFYQRHDGTIGGIEYSNVTTVNSTFGTINSNQVWVMGQYLYYRIHKNSAISFDMQYSPNGVHWLDVQLARNESGFAVADQVGFSLNSNNSQQSLIAIDYYRVSP